MHVLFVWCGAAHTQHYDGCASLAKSSQLHVDSISDSLILFWCAVTGSKFHLDM
jgi:hypothetical protein